MKVLKVLNKAVTDFIKAHTGPHQVLTLGA